MEGHDQGVARAQAALPPHRHLGHPRHRVPVRNARAHRDDQSDLRRPLHRDLRRAPTCRCAASSRSRNRSSARLRAPHRERGDARARSAASTASRSRIPASTSPIRRSSMPTATRSVAAPGPPTFGFSWDDERRPQSVPARARQRTAGRRRRDRDRQEVGRRGRHHGRPACHGAHAAGRQGIQVVGIAKFGTADSALGASVVQFTLAGGAAHRRPHRRPVQQHRCRRRRRRVARGAARPDRRSDARPTTSRWSPVPSSPKRTRTTSISSSTSSTASCSSSRRSRCSSRASSSTTRSRSSSRSERARWRCCARSARRPGR